MKRVLLGMSAILVLAVGMAACKKAATPPAPGTDMTTGAPATGEAVPAPTPPTTAVPPGGTIAPDDIAQALSKAVCGRMSACEPKREGQPPVKPEDCASMMSKDLAQALPEKAKLINRDQLTGCVAAIDKATCDELNAPTAPKGCEFMD